MHKKKAGKLQTGSTIPKQYWLAVNGKPKTKQGDCLYEGLSEIHVLTNKMQTTTCFKSIRLDHCLQTNMLSTAEYPLRNPDCDSSILPLSSVKLYSLLLITPDNFSYISDRLTSKIYN